MLRLEKVMCGVLLELREIPNAVLLRLEIGLGVELGLGEVLTSAVLRLRMIAVRVGETRRVVRDGAQSFALCMRPLLHRGRR
jgi:hypothetical protein